MLCCTYKIIGIVLLTCIVQPQNYYHVQEGINVVGTHLLEIFVDGVQLDNSPLLLSVIPLDCTRIYGADSFRVNDANGGCVCSNMSIEIGAMCLDLCAVEAVKQSVV